MLVKDRLEKAARRVEATRRDAAGLLATAGMGEHTPMKAVSGYARSLGQRMMFAEERKVRAYVKAVAELYSARESMEHWRCILSDAKASRLETKKEKKKKEKRDKPWRVPGVDRENVKLAHLGVAQRAAHDADADADHLAPAVVPVLSALASTPPCNWRVNTLRKLAWRLLSEGRMQEARDIQAYADARQKATRARCEVNRIRTLLRNAERRDTRKREKAERPKLAIAPAPVVVDPVTSQAIPVHLLAATPQDKAPIRLRRRRTDQVRPVPPWEEGPNP